MNIANCNLFLRHFIAASKMSTGKGQKGNKECKGHCTDIVTADKFKGRRPTIIMTEKQ